MARESIQIRTTDGSIPLEEDRVMAQGRTVKEAAVGMLEKDYRNTICLKASAMIIAFVYCSFAM